MKIMNNTIANLTPAERKRLLGCIPSIHDDRDVAYDSSIWELGVMAMPVKADVLKYQPPIYDQGQLGSCTANAIARALQTDMIKKSFPSFTPSRLFVYYNERDLEGTVDSDSGAQIKDGMKTVVAKGFCDEFIWPYNDKTGVFRVKPSTPCYAQALQVHHKARTYKKLRTLLDIKHAILNDNGVVMGFSVYSSFYRIGSDGKMPMPHRGEALEGGHAVYIAGYDDAAGMCLVANSWGDSWGLKGYFLAPYEFIQSANVFDLWVLNTS